MARYRSGPVFTTVFAAIFAAAVWFLFWQPNTQVVRERVAARAADEEQGELPPLTVRLVRSPSNLPVVDARVRWRAPDGREGEARTDRDGVAHLQVPMLGRYRLIVPEDDAADTARTEIGFRYKVGAERGEVTIPVAEAP